MTQILDGKMADVYVYISLLNSLSFAADRAWHSTDSHKPHASNHNVASTKTPPDLSHQIKYLSIWKFFFILLKPIKND